MPGSPSQCRKFSSRNNSVIEMHRIRTAGPTRCAFNDLTATSIANQTLNSSLKKLASFLPKPLKKIKVIKYINAPMAMQIKISLVPSGWNQTKNVDITNDANMLLITKIGSKLNLRYLFA
jgi:hypothetical protein